MRLRPIDRGLYEELIAHYWDGLGPVRTSNIKRIVKALGLSQMSDENLVELFDKLIDKVELRSSGTDLTLGD